MHLPRSCCARRSAADLFGTLCTGTEPVGSFRACVHKHKAQLSPGQGWGAADAREFDSQSAGTLIWCKLWTWTTYTRTVKVPENPTHNPTPTDRPPTHPPTRRKFITRERDNASQQAGAAPSCNLMTSPRNQKDGAVVNSTQNRWRRLPVVFLHRAPSLEARPLRDPHPALSSFQHHPTVPSLLE